MRPPVTGPAAMRQQAARPHPQFAVQRKMVSPVIQRTVWEWELGKNRWKPLRTEGSPTAPPRDPGTYDQQRVSTGLEDPWAAIPEPVVAPVRVAEERDATWRSNTRLPLYAEAFGVEINPNGCHAEEEILAQLNGKRSEKQDKSTTRIWTGRANKVTTEKALNLELNAWPCCGAGDPDCHAKLSQFASANGVTVTVKVVGDSGGYEAGHRTKSNWVDGATKITYTGTTITYSK